MGDWTKLGVTWRDAMSGVVVIGLYAAAWLFVAWIVFR